MTSEGVGSLSLMVPVQVGVVMSAVAAGCRKKDEAEQIAETVGEAMSGLEIGPLEAEDALLQNRGA